MALALGRSPTSLSDIVITQDTPPSWHLVGSLARRRNISVPELTHKIDQSTRTTYQESFADSPTIPGRPALGQVASEMLHNERSSNIPGNWRDCPFGDAMVAGVAQPQVAKPPSTQWATPMREAAPAFNPTRPLSPIFSPVECTTPKTAVARSPISPIGAPDVPPKVPPKTVTDGGSPAPKTDVKRKPSRGWLRFGASKQHLKIDASGPPLAWNGSHPCRPAVQPSPTLSTCATLVTSPDSRISPRTKQPTSASSSPKSKSEGRVSPDYSHCRKASVASDSSVMERARPIKEHKKAATLSYLVQPYDIATNVSALPTGMRPMEAVLILPDAEKESLRDQAAGQAQQFEVLGAKHVADLSRELRALDERCEYLRRTYKSLRSGRQKLHVRMLSYLKSDSLIFSKERLIKQQEALIELDKSIDHWIVKLERAENRRLRLRQKLLEHVAAAMALGPPSQCEYPQAPSYLEAQRPLPVHAQQTTTPPRSPDMSPISPRYANLVIKSPKPLRLDRKEVESIKIYADDQVLNLFSDIEQAVTKMCEAC
ncbi:Up-regulated during septation-domain-containing protein [Venturia nashicola]|nr:Up-regulated during septation-domain-containing protein [Venturia nashicola]